MMMMMMMMICGILVYNLIYSIWFNGQRLWVELWPIHFIT